MKAVEVKNITDEQWKSFALKYKEEVKLGRKPESHVTEWSQLKEMFLKNFNNWKTEKYNFYIVFDNEGSAVTWFDVNFQNKAMFDFVNFNSGISEDAFKCMSKILIEYIDSVGKEEIFTIEESQMLIDDMKKMNAEIYDEPVYSVLKKKDLNLELLKKISSNDIGNNLKLEFYQDIPEEIYDSFIELDNEACIDKEKFHPKKKIPNQMERDDLLRAINSKNIDKHPFYMYALLDKNKVAAFCSVYIRDNGKSIDHIGSLGLTAVGRKYRGRGFAKYLKAKMYLKMLDERPDFEYIITDTYSWNKYMYRINEDFGFKPWLKTVRFRFKKEFLIKLTEK